MSPYYGIHKQLEQCTSLVHPFCLCHLHIQKPSFYLLPPVTKTKDEIATKAKKPFLLYLPSQYRYYAQSPLLWTSIRICITYGCKSVSFPPLLELCHNSLRIAYRYTLYFKPIFTLVHKKRPFQTTMSVQSVSKLE